MPNNCEQTMVELQAAATARRLSDVSERARRGAHAQWRVAWECRYASPMTTSSVSRSSSAASALYDLATLPTNNNS